MFKRNLGVLGRVPSTSRRVDSSADCLGASRMPELGKPAANSCDVAMDGAVLLCWNRSVRETPVATANLCPVFFAEKHFST